MLEKKTLLEKPSSEPNIRTWIVDLVSSNESERLKARSFLVSEGANALPELIQVLSNGNRDTRMEVAKILVQTRDPASAQALVHALEDEDHDIRWTAMKGLIALERDGLEALLQALMKDFDSVWLREGAHHILNVLKKKKYLRQPSLQVLQALEGVVPEVTVAGAAEAAWESLFGPQKEHRK
jgi:HEAT repeat protein